MRKTVFFLMMAIACSINSSCTKTSDNLSSGDSLIPESSGSKDANTYVLSTRVGHKCSECGGRCIQINGVPTHADCMGVGRYCALLSSVTISQSGTAVTATTTDTFGLTSGDFFLMPDRSLNYTDENNNRMYLNIPEQLVFRDSVTRQFTFTGLFFTDDPEYTNE